MINEPIYQEGTTILNVYAPITVSMYLKDKLLERINRQIHYLDC